MRLRTLPLVTVAVLGLLAAAIPVAAHGPGQFRNGDGDGVGQHLLRMADVLGLSDAQKSQVQSIIDKQKDSALPQGSMRAARETLARTIHDPSATDAQVRDAAAAVSALDAQRAVNQHRMMIEVQAVLTPDQKTKLDELKADWKERRFGPQSN